MWEMTGSVTLYTATAWQGLGSSEENFVPRQTKPVPDITEQGVHAFIIKVSFKTLRKPLKQSTWKQSLQQRHEVSCPIITVN